MLLLLSCPFTSHVLSLVSLYSNIVSQVTPLQATLQFGLWAAVDDMKRLSFAMWTLVSFDTCQLLQDSNFCNMMRSDLG